MNSAFRVRQTITSCRTIRQPIPPIPGVEEFITWGRPSLFVVCRLHYQNMPGSLTHDIVQGPPPPVNRGWGDGGGSGGGSRRVSFTGLYVLLAASTMVFAALTSALVVRRGLSDDWASMAKPPILWVNTAVLL